MLTYEELHHENNRECVNRQDNPLLAGATIALSATLILCLVGSIYNVILYSIIGTNVSVLCGLVKEICDSEFNKEDFLATMFWGIVSIVITLFSLL